MKVFIATHEKQKERKNDFCFCKEGELVMFGMECDGEAVDGTCGCRRSMIGMTTNRATTTFKVRDIKFLKKEDYINSIKLNLENAGWLKTIPKKKVESMIKCDTEILLNTADKFPEGIVLEKRGDKIQIRV